MNSQALEVPELGPALGRLLGPGAGPVAEARLGLVTSLFEAAASARASGDPAPLGAGAWRSRWETAVAVAAKGIAHEAEARLAVAAREARMPARVARHAVLAEPERRGVAARLGAEGAPLIRSLDLLSEPGSADWPDRILLVARTLESSWLALESAAEDERKRWLAEAERLRGWRRPTWPVMLAITAVVLALGWLGLALGGWVPAGPLAPLRDWLLVLP